MASDALSSAAPRAPAAEARGSSDPARVLIRGVNWLGDAVMSLPAMRAVRRRFPHAHLALLIRRELAPLFEGAGFIDELIPYSTARGLGGVADRARLAVALRGRRFTLAVIMPNSIDSALWVALAGIPRRAGFSLNARGLLLSLRAVPDRTALGGHQVNYWLSMVRQTLAVEGNPADFRLGARPSSVAKMAAWLTVRRRRPDAALIALAPGAAYGPAKQWPASHYAALIDLLSEVYGAECVLVGAPGERSTCESIVAQTKHGALISAGETDVGEMAAMLSLASGFAGNDSGAMHVAAAVGAPTVGIFGSTDPERTGPMGARVRVLREPLECSPCLARTCRFGHYNCLKRIAPERVAVALQDLGALGAATRREGDK